MKTKTPSLFFCILMDLLGYASFSVPVIGELSDLVWAPVSAIIFLVCFGRKKFGLRGSVFAFLEELLPGTDFIPTFTIAWLIKKAESRLKESPALQKIF